MSPALTTKASQRCQRCAENPDRPCRSCAARRRTAVRLFEQGELAISEIAQHMRLSSLRVMRLLEESYDRHGFVDLRDERISVEVVRERFEAWRRDDPDTHTFIELARLAGFGTSSRVQRLLGEIPTSRVVKGDVAYPGRIRTTISCENAGRLVRAMGHIPAEIPGL